MNRFVPWLRELAEQGGKGAVNNIDARAIGRVADELERLSQDRNAANSGQICSECLFYETRDSTCRFNPPARLPRQFDSTATANNRKRDETIIWGWPVVEIFDWCGRWMGK